MWLRWFVPVLVFYSEHVQANDVTVSNQVKNILLPQDRNSENTDVINRPIFNKNIISNASETSNVSNITTIIKHPSSTVDSLPSSKSTPTTKLPEINFVQKTPSKSDALNDISSSKNLNDTGLAANSTLDLRNSTSEQILGNNVTSELFGSTHTTSSVPNITTYETSDISIRISLSNMTISNVQEKNKTVDLPSSNMDVLTPSTNSLFLNGTFNSSRDTTALNESTTEMTIKYGHKIINSTTFQIYSNFTAMGNNSNLLLNITEVNNISNKGQSKNVSNSNHSFHISTDIVELRATTIKHGIEVPSFFGGVCLGIVILLLGYIGKKYYKLYYPQRNIYRSFTYYPEERDTFLLD